MEFPNSIFFYSQFLYPFFSEKIFEKLKSNKKKKQIFLS